MPTSGRGRRSKALPAKGLSRALAGEQAAVGTEAAHHLQAERHALGIGTAGQRDGRVCGERDHVGEREPAVVVLLLAPVDHIDVRLRPGERRHRRGRRQHQVVAGKYRLEAADDAGLLRLRPGAIEQAHAGAHLIVGAWVGAQAAGVAFVGGAHARHKGLGAKHVEAAVHITQIEAHLVARGEQVLHGRDLFAERGADDRVHIACTKVFRVGHAQARQVAGTRVEERQRVQRMAQRIARVHAGRSRHLQAGVVHGAAHRPHHRDRRPAQRLAPTGDHAGRGPEPHHPAARGGNAQRATGIGARAHRQHVQRERRGRSAGGAARVQIGVERVAGGAPDGVAAVRARAHLGHIGLAHHDGARLAQARHQFDVTRWHVVAQRR